MLHSFKKNQLSAKEAGKVLGGYMDNCAELQNELDIALADGDMVRAKMLMRQIMMECREIM